MASTGVGELAYRVSVRMPVMAEERIRQHHWLELVLCVPFTILALMIEWQEGHRSIKIMLH